MAYSVPTLGAGQVLTSAMYNVFRDNDIYLQDRIDNPPRAAIYHNTTQSIGTGSAAAVTWNSEYSDAAGMHAGGAPTRLTVPTGQSGWWLFTVAVDFAANATGQRELALRFDGSVIFGKQAVQATSAGTTALSLAVIVQLNAASYAEAMVTQNSGGALNLATSPYFAAQRIA